MNKQNGNFTWFDKLTRVLNSLPAEYVGEMALAIANYGTYGDEPQFSEPLLGCVFEGIRDDIDNSVKWREDRRNQKRNDKGQFASNIENEETAGETVSEPYGDRTDTVTDTADTVTEKMATVTDAITYRDRPTKQSKAKQSNTMQSKENIYTQKAYQVQQSEPDLQPPQGRSAQTDPRALAFLCVFNEETGKSFSTLPLECANRLIATAYTTEDVRAMIRHKRREWDNAKMRKFITPKTLFGNKFDAYMDEAKNAKAEVSEYAKYDR